MAKKIIAVDFDGTIVDDAYPRIGQPKMFAFETLKRLENEGNRLILWTFRTGKSLNEAVEFCRKHGLEFYAVNASFPGEEFNEKEQSRKIHADLFIDDRNLGGFPGWGEVYQIISQKLNFTLHNSEPSHQTRKMEKNGMFKFFK